MDKIKKRKYYDLAFIIVLGLLIVSIPFSLFIKDLLILNILDIFTRIIAIFVVLYLILKNNYLNPNKAQFKLSHFKYLPLILLSFSNLFVSLILNFERTTFDLNSFLANFIICLLTAVLEELLFRYLLLGNLSKDLKPVKAIIISSLIFGLTHLLNISSLGSIIPSLLQVVYSFFLGLILGYLYLDSNLNIFYPIIFHFAFNFFNGFMASFLFDLKWNYQMLLLNVLIGLIILSYLVILIVIKKRKDKLNVTKNLDL